MAHLAERLRYQPERINRLSSGDRALDAALELSYQRLPDIHRQLLRALGLLPAPTIDATMAAELIDADSDTATQLLDSLIDHNLLIESSSGRYRIHDLVRLYVRSLAPDAPV